jgi:hypothetical protein
MACEPFYNSSMNRLSTHIPGHSSPPEPLPFQTPPSGAHPRLNPGRCHQVWFFASDASWADRFAGVRLRRMGLATAPPGRDVGGAVRGGPVERAWGGGAWRGLAELVQTIMASSGSR